MSHVNVNMLFWPVWQQKPESSVLELEKSWTFWKRKVHTAQEKYENWQILQGAKVKVEEESMGKVL